MTPRHRHRHRHRREHPYEDVGQSVSVLMSVSWNAALRYRAAKLYATCASSSSTEHIDKWCSQLTGSEFSHPLASVSDPVTHLCPPPLARRTRPVLAPAVVWYRTQPIPRSRGVRLLPTHHIAKGPIMENTTLLGPFHGTIAVPSVTRCRCCCCRGHRTPPAL